MTIFLQYFKQRIQDCKTQDWHNEINASPRCDTYKLFKSLLTPEKYLTIDVPFKSRRAYARFRCSNHKLNIELGRHFNVQRENRTCLFCLTRFDVHVLENEFHAFFECPQYTDIRTSYLYNWYNGQRNETSFNILMSSTDITVIKQLTFYVTKLMNVIGNINLPWLQTFCFCYILCCIILCILLKHKCKITMYTRWHLSLYNVIVNECCILGRRPLLTCYLINLEILKIVLANDMAF